MDETIHTPEAEVIDSTESTTEQKVEETIDSITPKEESTIEPKVVPEAAFLQLKSELKAIKKELKEATSSEKKHIVSEGIADLTIKYPDVSPEFIQDMLNSATIEATKKIEAKYSPIIEKQEQEKKQAAFDSAFNNLFEKTLNDNPDLPKDIDKEAIKELASTPKYRNTPLSEILFKMYKPVTTEKSSSENEMRSGADRVEDIVSFDKITSDQKKAIMDDPKARAKYFSWLDTQVGR